MHLESWVVKPVHGTADPSRLRRERDCGTMQQLSGPLELPQVARLPVRRAGSPPSRSMGFRCEPHPFAVIGNLIRSFRHVDIALELVTTNANIICFNPPTLNLSATQGQRQMTLFQGGYCKLRYVEALGSFARRRDGGAAPLTNHNGPLVHEECPRAVSGACAGTGGRRSR